MRSRLRLLGLMLLVMVVAGCVDQLPGVPGLPGGGGGPGGAPGGGGGTVGTVEQPIRFSQDDGYRNNSLGNVQVSLYSLNGMWFGGSPGSYEASAFFRWRNVQIPTGAKILEAHVRVKHRPTSEPGVNKWDTRIDVRGFAYDSAPVFREDVDTDTLDRTESVVPWDIEEPWSDTEAEWHQTPDLAAVIQEIVDRPGWRAGKAIGIAFDARLGARPPAALEYNRSIYSYEADADAAPVLFVKYTR